MLYLNVISEDKQKCTNRLQSVLRMSTIHSSLTKRHVGARPIHLQYGEQIRPVLARVYIGGIGAQQIMHAISDLTRQLAYERLFSEKQQHSQRGQYLVGELFASQ